MKRIFTHVSIMVAFMALSLSESSIAQMVGDQIFLKGKWVEVGVAPNGSLGSTVLPPTGVYHCNSPTFTFWDPAAASATTSNQRLMMVFDAGHDGWTTGTPGFFGDYSMPGTPYEGWGIQINGAHSEAQMQYFQTTGATGFAGGAGLTGTNSAYLNPSGQTIGIWSGTAASGSLQITQRTTLDTNASWVNMNVKLKNVSGTTLTGVYYIRETDPDNDQTAPGGSFVTTNVINYQNDYLRRVMVTATGTLYTTQTLSLATKDCRAKCYIHSGWPMSTGTNLATLYSSGAGGFSFSGTVYGDVAIGLIFNCGNIAAGDSTELNYTYIFNGLTGLDSSIANPQLVVNGIPRDTTDTVTSCSFSGSSLACSIINGSTADWFGSTWTWAPSTYLSATTGLTNTIAVSSITTPITYTITGTTTLSGCAGKTFHLTVMPPGTTPAPTTTTSLSYCLGATTTPLTATGIGTIRWFTSLPSAGSTTPPTPTTTSVGTTTYWVTQTVAGCPSDTIPITVTVFALGTVTTGSLFACTGYTTTLSNATAGGTWSSSNMAVGTVGSTTGVVYGVSAGTTNITYHVLGCIDVKTVTVTPTPGAITGLSTVCVGTSTTLSNSVAGGTWQTSSGNISVGSTTGVVTGISVGTGVVTYNMGGGCFVTRIMTVNPFPSAISGPTSVCVGASISLSSSTSGGLWTSTPVTIASVGALTGIVTGSNPGTTTIRYTVGGCAAQVVVTVVSAAPPIVGPGSVCVGSTISMSTASPGGTWSAACPAILSINPSTGVVTGVGTGTCIITYAVSAGCTDTAIVTVTPAPPAIGANVPLCVGQTNTLTHSTTGGTWSLACPTIATVGLGTGLVTALAPGTCTVTYTLPGGCISVATLTVNPTTAPITGTTTLCQGSSATLSCATPGGTWSSSGASASIGASTGTWTAGTAGTATITYTPPSGCIATTVVTAVALPSPITGTSPICVGQSVTWTTTPAGGVWSTVAVGVATVSGTGDVTGTGAGTTTISYTLPSGCGVGKIVTVNAGPAPITGSLGMCVGGTTSLSSITSGGTWSAGCGGILTLLTPGFYGGSGAGTCTVSYTVSGCSATAVVTVNTLPAAIGGSLSVCNGDCTTLTNTSTGGTWSSSNPAVATIGSSSGVMCGVSNGTVIITYSLGSGCITTSVATVSALPGGITGTLSICQSASVTLSSTPAGGSWSSDATSTVSIGSTSGVATGGLPGTATISYSLSTGCRRTVVMTVNAAPSTILGGANVCVGTCTTLTSTPAGGTWTTSNGNATIGGASGVACGAFAGTTTVTYTLPTGCYRTMTLLINGLPTGISPSGSALQVCEGSTLALTGSPAGGTWMSAPTTVGTISTGGGTLSGITSGTVAITYTLPTGCSLSAVGTVNPLPGSITGGLTTCVGQTTTLASTPSGGTWSVAGGTGGASIVSSTGVLTGTSGGTVLVTYTSTAGCRRTTTVTVYALPGTITGGGNLCPGGTSTVACLPAGGTWSVTPGTGTGTISSSGVITGGSAGTINVTYTLGTGCISTRIITVNTPPNPITGTLTTCVGSTTTLNTTTTGGVWTSVPSTIATVTSIGAGMGEVTGSNAGTALISYTDPATTCRATAQVTVYALPGAIGGALNACIGQCSALTNAATGGTWMSSNAAVGTIDVTTGVFCGISSGTTNITYTLGTGCNVTAVASVNPLPLSITGTAQVCQGATTTLSNATGSGSWSSSNITVATITAGGVVTGVTPGTATISYTLPTLCASTVIVTVYALPGAITGTPVICENSTTTLGSTPAGGTWGSSSSNVAVNPVTGDVTGVTAGTATVVYTQGIGCTRSVVVSVNPLPAAITGTLDVCLGRTVTLANATGGGTWTSSNTSAAPISSAGVVSGLALGTSTISYTLSTGCARSVIATVHAFPSAIVGSSGFCNLTNTTYMSTPGGGTWTSSDPSIFTVDPVTGNATGVNVGTATLSYTATYGCEVTKDITIILAPYPVTGDSSICLYDTVTLANVISGGVWTTSNAFVLPLVDAYSGKVIGASVGTGKVTYTLSTGCASELQMTVNNIPSSTTGTPQVCEASTMVLTNTTPGGTWTSGNNTIATIGSLTGIVDGISAGTVVMSYVLTGSGCNAQFVVTVNPLPDTITGVMQVCEGLTTTLISGPTGGAWSSAAPGIAYVDASTGDVTGVNAGVTQITYTLPTTCKRATDVTVNPVPSNNVGVTDICVNDQTTFTNTTPGGLWSVSNIVVGTIGATSGIYTSLTPGTNIISYTMPTGCVATSPITNHANPAPISGMTTVCAGFATNLYSGPAGGVWSQTPTSLVYGTINPVTGVVSGIMAGYIPVTYTLGTGCNTVDTVEVITLPAVIGGTPNVCVNDTTILTSTVAGGSWSSSNAARAVVDPVSGAVTGISAGTAVITYTVGTGCFNVLTITVNSLPAPITGTFHVCEQSSTLLNSLTPGGAWISGNTAVGTVFGPVGPAFSATTFTGVSAGTSQVTYMLFTGCKTMVTMTVDATPAPITGNPHICMGAANSFTTTSTGGVWSTSNPAIATINPVSGVATSVSLGVVTISYTYPGSGCTSTRVVTVQPLPQVFNVSGGGNFCAGGAGVHVNLSGSQPGVSYELYYGSSATGFLAGSGFPLDFGLHTAGGTYTVQATNVTSGCRRNMTGAATIVVNPLVTPAVTIAAAPNDSVCAGETVAMTAMPTFGGTAPTYAWKVNGTFVSTANNYSYIPADGDVVTVTMTSNFNCLASPTATGTQVLTVMPSATPIAGVTSTPGDTVCQFNPVTFSAAPTYGGATPSYTWMVNGTTAAFGPTFTYVPEDGDIVNLQMTSNYRCRTTNTVMSGDVTMSVDSIKIPTVNVTVAPGMIVAAGKPATLYAWATDAGPNPTFQWKVNGVLVPGATSETYTAIFDDYDSISVSVISSGVCHNIGTVDWFFIGTAPLSTSQPSATISDLRLVPNPNKGTFTISGNLATGNDEEVNVDVTDMLGQVVFRGVVKTKNGRMESRITLANNLANGMYMLTLRTNGEQKVFHFVMEQ